MSLRFQIGGSEHEYIRVEVLGSTTDGLVQSRIEISAGAFRGEYLSDLDCWAFSCFARELRDLHKVLLGTATFTTIERQLELSFVGDGLEHIQVQAEAMDYTGTGNKLIFRLEVDQTELLPLLRDLDAVVATYPPCR